MKIERLFLERYGHFTDKDLDFSAGNVRLHVVLGANEAGKTTALQAIGDLLYGIDVQSRYGFLHNYQDMRIRSDIQASEGRALSITRRKGQKNTLLDVDGHPLPDDALVPFLGTADRTLFRGLFGLTHQSLREGGEKMLAAKDDIGQMLFEAGTSIRHLANVLEGLKEETDQLFTTKRVASRKFYVALDAYTNARREMRELSITSKEWKTNKEELDDAIGEREAIRVSVSELQVQNAKVQRIRRLLPRLTELKTVREKLACVADAPDLPEHSRRHFDQAKEDLTFALRDAKRETETVESATQKLAKLDIPEPLLALAKEVKLAYEELGAVLKGKRDLPNRHANRRELWQELENLAKSIDPSLSVEDALRGLPPEGVVAEVRFLINRSAVEENNVDIAKVDLKTSEAELQQIENAVAELPEPPEVGALHRLFESIKGKGNLEEVYSKARIAEEVVRGELQRSLSALPLWNGDAANLVSLAVPDAVTMGRFEKDMAEVSDMLQRQRERLNDEKKRLGDTRRELSELLAQGDVPTEEVIKEVRTRRDFGWSLIRRIYVFRQKTPDEEVIRFAGDSPIEDAYEKSVAEADAVADRREREARRLARYAQLFAAQEASEDQIEQCNAGIERDQETQRSLWSEWEKAWSAAAVEVLPPREMEKWLSRRDGVLQKFETWQKASTKLTEAQEAVNHALASLTRLATPYLGDLGAGENVSTMLNRCEAFLKDTLDMRDRRKRLLEKRDEKKDLVSSQQGKLELFKGKRKEWIASWDLVVERAGLPSDVSIPAAEQSLGAWEKIRSKADRLGELDRRIEGIERDATSFGTIMSRIIQEASLDIDITDPVASCKEAYALLQNAERDQAKKDELLGQLESARKKLGEATKKQEKAELVLDELRQMASCGDDDALIVAIGRSEERRLLTLKTQEVENEILENADELTVEEAKAEAEGQRTDQLVAEIDEINERVRSLNDQSAQIGEKIKALSTKQEEMEKGRGASRALQEREDAGANLASCAQRWMVLKTATIILQRGIERFRQEQQGPMLARASEVFEQLTCESFARLLVDYDDKDNPVLLGERADGKTCHVDGMSDGTRDQLFLSLRLAAIQNYVALAEPLPFIADDLFVHFDDNRAAAGLDALIALGGATQVLFFTHHRHLADLAMQRGDSKTVCVHHL